VKITRIETLVSNGPFSNSKEWLSTKAQIEELVRRVEWPVGSGKFTIRPIKSKGRGVGNGVKPIKLGFMSDLKSLGWKEEEPLDIATVRRPGPIDAVLYDVPGVVALEWETGNISSSHRALNKLCLGLLKGVIQAGVLIVPTKNLAKFLTDRIGNLAELEPYFEFWRALTPEEGVLEIIAIEQDQEDMEAPLIPKGNDGRALN
jgi:hypothetical protein